MKALDKIKEEFFPLNDKQWLRSFFDEKYFKNDWNAYCIYTEVRNKPQLNWGAATPQGYYYPDAQGIVNYLNKHKPENFIETLFLLDLYTISCPVKCERDPDKITKNFSRLDSAKGMVIRSLIKDTRGILLWHYQLENILNIFINDRYDVYMIRKGIMKNNSESFERIDKLYVNATLTLKNFICDRMHFGHTVFPNVHGAYVLYDLIK